MGDFRLNFRGSDDTEALIESLYMELPRQELMSQQQIVGMKDKLRADSRLAVRVPIYMAIELADIFTPSKIRPVGETRLDLPALESVQDAVLEQDFKFNLIGLAVILNNKTDKAARLPDSRWPLGMPTPEQVQHAIAEVGKLDREHPVPIPGRFGAQNG